MQLKGDCDGSRQLQIALAPSVRMARDGTAHVGTLRHNAATHGDLSVKLARYIHRTPDKPTRLSTGIRRTLSFGDNAMKRIAVKSNCTLALVIAGLLAAGPAASEPPGGGGGKGDKSEKSQKNDKIEKSEKGQKNDKSDKSDKSERGDQSEKAQQRDRDKHSHHDSAGFPVRQYFEDRHRAVVRDYYSQEFDRGRCPPGLAKKHNGCMPPGQAKKWTVGRPLPRDVIFYDLEPQLVTLFGPPPSGHRYVRVASDILLIAIGSGTVVDSILDLGRM